MFDDPGSHGMETEILKGQREHLGYGLGRITAAATVLLASDNPEPRGLKIAIHLVETHDPERRSVLGHVDPEDMRVPLGHDLEQYRRKDLPAVAELQPLVVFLLCQPARDRENEFRGIKRFEPHKLSEFHFARRSYLTEVDQSCRWNFLEDAQMPPSVPAAYSRAKRFGARDAMSLR